MFSRFRGQLSIPVTPESSQYVGVCCEIMEGLEFKMSHEDNHEDWEAIHRALEQQPSLWESMQRLKEISNDFSASS